MSYYSFQSIPQLHLDLHNKIVSCKALVTQYLSTIKSTSHLNIFIEVWEEEALQRAIEIDTKIAHNETLGKLFGVIVSIKDILAYKNHKVSAASKILEDFVSPYSSTVVQSLLDEDAILIGRVNCDEFAMGSGNENSIYGACKNPHNELKVCGGSSGGSAASVSANNCMISLGSDTGGSVRQPADFCGVYGIKPTYGSISRYGLIAYGSSLDQIGVLTHNLQDLELVLSVISKKEEQDSTQLKNPIPFQAKKKDKIAIAYFKDIYNYPALDKEIKDANLSLINSLENDSNYIVQGVTTKFLEMIVPCYYILASAEASSNLSRYDGIRYNSKKEGFSSDLSWEETITKTRTEGFGKEVKRRIIMGSYVLSSGYYDAYFKKAQKIRQMLLDEITHFFSEFDFIILPNSPTVAWDIGNKKTDPTAEYLMDIFTVYANLVGCPAISVPKFKHSTGLPFGIQILTSWYNEKKLINFVEKIQLL